MQPDAIISSGTFVRGLRLKARVGVKPDELLREQLVELDIHLTDSASALAADTGRLRDALDYRRIARAAQQVVNRGHFRLVETLALEIGRALLQQTRAEAVRVRLHKLDCVPGAAAAGVEITLDQDAIHRDPKPLDPEQIQSTEAVAIVGGGVAGLSAALWCWRLGHPALLIDPGPLLGGQLNQVHFRMPDLPGFTPLSGHALARRLIRQFLAHRGRWLRASVCRVSADDAATELEVRDTGEESTPRLIRAAALIVCTGLRRRRLDVPGEAQLCGRGVLETASTGARQLAGRRVLVVGGGDAACENALKLVRAGAHVTIAFRRPQLSARDHFRRRVTAHARITLLPHSQLAAFRGGDQLTSVELTDGRTLETDAALVRIGFEPNSAGLPPEWLDARGYVRCDTDLRILGQSRVFVAGDLRDPAAPSVACAAGDAACAAKAATALVERPPPPSD